MPNIRNTVGIKPAVGLIGHILHNETLVSSFTVEINILISKVL